MSKESYTRGFCKAAAAAGVDPVALAKYAQEAIKKEQTSDYDLEKNRWMRFADNAKRTPTSPTVQDIMNLSAINQNALERFARGYNLRDYLTQMYKANPEATTSLMTMVNDKLDTGKLDSVLSKSLPGLAGFWRPLASNPNSQLYTKKEFSPVRDLNYSVITGLLDRIQHETGRDGIWDVDKRVPTPIGLGIKNPPVEAMKVDPRKPVEVDPRKSR